MVEKTLQEIIYPIYPLRKFDRLTDINGVVKVYTIYKMYIIDDRNLPGDTLGQRRLHIKKYKYPLRTSINNPKNLLMQGSKLGIYINESGLIFKYNKTERADLKYYKIKSITPLPFDTTKIIVKGINTPFIMYENIPTDFKYAGVLHIKGGYILYEVTLEKKKDSWRKV